MQPSYAYPPPQGQHGQSYQHSPATSNAVLPQVSLPPLRSIDGQQPPPPPQLIPSPVNQQVPQAMPPIQGYYAHHPQGMPHPGQPMPPYARYAPIPQGAGMPGGHGKKEIKRRTKTGCLTCRKRRIKVSSEDVLCGLVSGCSRVRSLCRGACWWLGLAKGTISKRETSLAHLTPPHHKILFHTCTSIQFHSNTNTVSYYSATNNTRSVAIVKKASASAWATIRYSSSKVDLKRYNLRQVELLLQLHQPRRLQL
jgi:hypothetical protein